MTPLLVLAVACHGRGIRSPTVPDAGARPPADTGASASSGEADVGAEKDTEADRAYDDAMFDVPFGTGGTGGGGSTAPASSTGGTSGDPVRTTNSGGMSGGLASAGVLGTSGGASSSGGTTTSGGTSSSGGASVSGGTTTSGGPMSLGGNADGGTVFPVERSSGPCDIYADANMPCAAAYSMIRALSKSYNGPLFQVRAGSSSTNNTMSGGTTMDIMPGPDGLVDSSVVDAACGKGYCTVSVLYDHSGNGNDLRRAPKGNTGAGATAGLDDYESIATKGLVTAGGHKAYSLYMNKLEGYRVQAGVVGKNMPTGSQSQGTYLLADGTRSATGCCWEFGNVTSKPATEWAFVDALYFGKPEMEGQGAGAGPWFLADLQSALWAGGSRDGDPGSPFESPYYGGDPIVRQNLNNPSLKVPFALGFLKVSSSNYAIRVADLSTANALVTAYDGRVPVTQVDHPGGIVLGVSAENANASWGTFYEGAIVAGYPTNDVELSIMKNIKAVGYAK
jgi:non-reducing end alpha-L-arabinofuranosidase